MPRAAPRSLAYSSSSQTAASAYRRGRGHEQPQVGGVQELVGELPVRGHHRVDVRRVEQGDALGHALAGGEDEQPVAARTGPALPGGRGAGWAGRRSPRTSPPRSGWQASTGLLVVGRRIPVALTWAPTMLFTSVDLPAPVEPTRATRIGASDWRIRGQQVVIDLAEQLAPLGPGGLGALGLVDQVHVHDPAPQREQGRLELPGIDPAMPPRFAAPGITGPAAAGPGPGRVAGGVPGRTGSAAGTASVPAARADAAARPCPSVIALLSLPFARGDDSGGPG